MAKAAGDILGYSTGHITPSVVSSGVIRPHDCHLSNGRLAQYMELPEVNFEKQIRKSWLDPVSEHTPNSCQKRSGGETNLESLLKNISPKLEETVFVFATMTKTVAEKYLIYSKMVFYEKEGVTLILPKEHARNR